MKYSNADVDKLVEQLNATFDEKERTDLTKRISQKVLDDNPYIFFGNSPHRWLAPPDSRALGRGNSMILKVAGICKSFRTRDGVFVALDDVNLQVDEGEVAGRIVEEGKTADVLERPRSEAASRSYGENRTARKS